MVSDILGIHHSDTFWRSLNMSTDSETANHKQKPNQLSTDEFAHQWALIRQWGEETAVYYNINNDEELMAFLDDPQAG